MADAAPDWPALRAALGAGRTTAVALTEASLGRIADRDGAIRAFVSVDAGGARASAAASDARRAAGAALGPLDGVPVAVKDNIAVRGSVTTRGHGAEGIAPDAADAGVVARLRAAGAVVVGKLNLHEGALGATTDNPHHGRSQNPLAEGFTPGGSSGGSAAAVAAGMVPATLGTDTMGSVRIPAAYCGLFGLKPSAGAVGRSGLAHLSPTLDTIGPIAATAEDIVLLWNAIAGADAGDPDSEPVAAVSLGERPTVGLLDVAGTLLEPAVADGLARAVAGACGLGWAVRDVALPGWEPSRARRAGLLVSEAEAAMILGAELAAAPERFGAEFAAFVRYGAAVPAPRLAAAYTLVRQTGAAVRRLLREVDILLLPTAPQRAFPHGGAVPADQADLTAIANFAGVPAVALPVPADGLPASVQLVGPRGADRALAVLAGALAAAST